MSEWRELKFSDTFSIPLRNGLTKPSSIRGTGTRMVNMKEIFSYDRIDDCTPMEQVPLSSGETIALLEFNDLLFARQSLVESGAGKISIFKGRTPTVFESHLIRCRVNKEIAEPDFLYHYWKSPFGRGSISTIVTQTAAAGIKGSALQTLPILLPPLPEQRAIASVLSSLDDKIDLLHRQNKTLEAMAETLFRQWLVDEADKRWEEGKVEDYCIHYKEGVKPQESATTIFTHFSIPSFDDGMNPVIEAGSEIQSNKYIVPHNCILFSKLNPHKDKRLWLMLNELPENSVCSTEFQVVLPKSNDFLFLIYCWLSLSQNYKEIASGVGGTSGSHQRIDPADIFSFPCPRISDSVIKDFNKRIESIFLQMQKNRVQILTLEKLRDTLLPKLMSGEVRLDV